MDKPYLRRPRQRPPELRLDLVLAAAGQLTDTAAGWASYLAYLDWQAETGPAGKSEAYVSLSKGWAVGSAGFKTALIEDHALAATARAWESKGAEEIQQRAWEAICRRALRVLQRTDSDLTAAAKAAPWKVALAMVLKERSQASNHWLGQRLKMGSAKYVGYLVSVTKHSAQLPEELSILRASSDLTP